MWNRLWYVFFGLVAATFFGIGTFIVYGSESLVAYPWVDYVFWWLIGSGVVLALLDDLPDLRCLICRHLPAGNDWCATAPCAG